MTSLPGADEDYPGEVISVVGGAGAESAGLSPAKNGLLQRLLFMSPSAVAFCSPDPLPKFFGLGFFGELG